MTNYRKSKTPTIADVRAQLREVGISITRDTVGSGLTGSGEYRVAFSLAKDAWPGLMKKSAEAKAYYTDDLDDALRTGLALAKEGVRHAIERAEDLGDEGDGNWYREDDYTADDYD